MKVLFTNHHPSDGGGHTTYIIELARRLCNDCQVIIAAPKSSKLNSQARDIPNINVMDVDFPGTLKEPVRLFSAVFRLAFLIFNQKIDVVHVNGSPDHRILVYVSWLLGRKLPIVFTKHNTFPTSSIGNRLRAKYTATVIAVCESLVVSLKNSAYKSVPIVCIPNGIDINHFAPVLSDRESGKIIFVSVAGTPLYKGWQYLVAAVATLPASVRVKIEIIIAGVMPTKEIIERYVTQLNMGDCVVFTGVVEDVRQIIAKATVGFVLSDGVETISFACREMMAMGKPVMVSDYSGLPENIDDGIDGWITKTGDTDSIREKVIYIINNLDKIPAMGICARAKAVRSFGIEGFAINTMHVYTSVVNKFGG